MVAGRAGRIRIEARHEPGRAAVLVRDNGGGVPVDIHERLFKPYVTTSPPGEGQGLGLAISRKIMLEHGGDLELLKTSPAGTTFHLWLPLPAGAGRAGESRS